jgi:hypothetical protein
MPKRSGSGGAELVTLYPGKRTVFIEVSDDPDPHELVRPYPRKPHVVTQITRAEAPAMQCSGAGRRLREGVMDSRASNSIEPGHLPRLLTNMIPAPALVSSGSRRRVFTPTAINAIRVLAAQGKSASEIAAAIGSTPGSVRVKCCQLKIPLRRRWQQARQIGARSLLIHLDDADYAALRRKAADMQKSAVELTGELLRAVIRGDIYEAVLDDDG